MRYYSTQRPVMPGSFPVAGARKIHIHNYDRRTYIPEIGREAWGYIEYDPPITEKEARAYELTPASAGDETFPNVEQYMTEHDFIPADKLKVREFLREQQAVAAVITRTEIRFKHKDGVMGRVGRGDIGIQDNFI